MAKAGKDENKATGEKKLKQLLKDAGNAYKDGREIAGGLGQKIRSAIDHDHLHPKAFAILRQFDRMTPEKLNDCWEALQYYMDISGLNERAASAPKLRLVADKDAEEAEDGEGESGDGKPKPGRTKTTKPFPTPTGVAAE